MCNEQWKESGNCKECRRNNYCKNKCKAYKVRTDRELKSAVAKAIFGHKYQNLMTKHTKNVSFERRCKCDIKRIFKYV